MYDTIEILSPKIPLSEIENIKKLSSMIQKIDLETGEILYQITTGDLVGSYDSRLSIKIHNGCQVKLCGSVHKFILGHNIFGGPNDIKQCCRYLVALAQKRLQIEMPSWVQWQLMRVDVAHVFNMGSLENAQTYIDSMKGLMYPRRKTRKYGSDAVYFAGVSTTLKCYNKGSEFKQHDKKKLKESLNKANPYNLKNTDIDMLEQMSLQLLRFEVEIRKRKMKYDRVDNTCGILNDEYFTKVYETEILKVLQEGGSDMVVVNELGEVKSRLNQVYDKRKANNLFGVWTRIQMEGQAAVKGSVNRTTWYRYKKDFARAGISLCGLCTVTWQSTLPRKYSRLYDFVPLPGDRNHIAGEFLDVREAIENLLVA